MYSENEKYEILRLYHKNNNNACATQREYHLLYPERRLPDRKTIKKIDMKLRTTFSLKRKKRVVRHDEESEINILLAFEEHPNKSIRQVSNELKAQYDQRGYCYSTIRRLLHSNNLKPYKLHPVSALTEQQKEKRLIFCNYMLNRITNEPNFLNRILWTDESTFSTSGKPNRQNARHWSRENPYSLREIQFQGRASVNVWCGIISNKIVGPLFLQQTLNGERYLNYLRNDINDFLDELPLNQYLRLIFQQDGAPAHNVRNVTNFLNLQYHEWIGINGTIRWPPNSPDLTPMDAFLWGYLKDIIRKEGPDTIERIQNRITEEITILNSEQFNSTLSAVTNLTRRFRLCIEQNGGYFEHLMN